MNQPGNQDWDDIIATGTDDGSGPGKAGKGRVGPFASSQPIDGYAFTLDPESPELRYHRQPPPAIPAPPRRPPPQRIRDQMPLGGVWQPGGSARTARPTVQAFRPSLVKALLSGLVPLALLGGGIYLVMRLSGF